MSSRGKWFLGLCIALVALVVGLNLPHHNSGGSVDSRPFNLDKANATEACKEYIAIVGGKRAGPVHIPPNPTYANLETAIGTAVVDYHTFGSVPGYLTVQIIEGCTPLLEKK